MAHGRYTIVGKLADGGMAEIFLAMQHGAEGFQKPVVLKRVLSAFSADQQFRNMFLDEAHISMSLAHGNIVQVLDVGVAGERTFLVLELVEGWDLEQIMERAQATGPDHPWPPSLALYVTAQICRGLAYAHNKKSLDGRPLGIVHRDVSPNNVLISEQGEVKLADFGIAKAERKREQTLAGVIKGKIGFMSPEQALGRGLDARADLFSVGTVMYLMLTGQKPFQAPSELESMMKAQQGDYRPPDELNPYLSKELVAIVNRAMRADPAARYQTADQMLSDVERVLRAEYKSAGQTELKVWLSELTRRDGILPIGRTRPTPGAEGDVDAARPVLIDEGGDLSAGTSVELSDLDDSDGSGAGAGATEVSVPPVAAAPGMVPVRARIGDNLPPIPADLREILGPAGAGIHGATTVVAPAPTERPGTPVGSGPLSGSVARPPAREPSADASPPAGSQADVRTVPPSSATGPTVVERKRKSRVGIGFVLGALCMLGAVFGIRWLAQWAGRERVGPSSWYEGASKSQPAPGPATPTPPGHSSAESPAGPRAEETSGGGTGVGGAAGSAIASADVREGGADAPTGDGGVAPVASGAGDLDDDEEHLVRLVPDAAAVIGEEEAEENDKSANASASAKKGSESPAGTGKPAPAVAERKDGDKVRAEKTPRAKTQPVQVRITTSPLGAVVRTKKQVLGRTPIAIKFKPGNTYELTFVKSGYVTHSRRLAVGNGKPKSVSVAMKKAPAARRSFFGR